MTERSYGLKPAAPSACADCPWRKSNHGKRHPGGWFTKKNATRLWAGLRTGEAPGMSCHPTDPLAGRGLVPGPDARECTGALLLVQRELAYMETLIEHGDQAYKCYRHTRPRGLTRAGILWWVGARASALANTPLGGPPMSKIEEDDEIDNPTLTRPA